MYNPDFYSIKILHLVQYFSHAPVQPSYKHKTPLPRGFAVQITHSPLNKTRTQFFDNCMFKTLNSPSATAIVAVCSAYPLLRQVTL